jgi:hypothetical protein
MNNQDEDNPSRPDEQRDLQEFEQKQAKELEEFEAKQKHELAAFEQREAKELREFEVREDQPVFEIKIDRAEYKVHQRTLTGQELRNLPNPPIGPDRDLFEVVPGGSDVKIADNQVVQMRNGLRFFTAPAQINPGNP